MEKIQAISKRCSVMLKDNVYSLVILPTENQKKINWLFLWLMAWSVSGIIILINYFTLTNDKARMMIIIWLAFWAYFEYKIVRVFMWKKFGKEKLWIKNGSVHYQQSVAERGKVTIVDANVISEFKLIPIEKDNFADMFNQTFWVKGGERIEFTAQAKVTRFAMQLTDDEAKKIVTSINKFLTKK